MHEGVKIVKGKMDDPGSYTPYLEDMDGAFVNADCECCDGPGTALGWAVDAHPSRHGHHICPGHSRRLVVLVTRARMWLRG